MKKASAKQVKEFRDQARFVIEHHFGSRPARIKQRSGGLSNFVFEVKHAEGDFILRIGPDKGRLNAFIKEQWCERVARSAGVPTAEILEVGGTLIPFPYVIARRVEGSDGIHHPERIKIIHELGRLATRINSIKTKGFGETFEWSNNELSRNATFGEYFEREYKYADRIEQLNRSGLCSPQTIKALKRICSEMKKLKPRPVLNHGDLRLKNVIADDDGRIRAIIDWEKATSNNAPSWEFSIALHDLGIDLAEQFVAGYGITPKRLADISPHIKAFNLMNYTDEIGRATREKDRPALARLRARLAGTYDLYVL